MNLYQFLPRLIAAIVSIFQASTMRDRYYTALNRIEILETALDDIKRISESRVASSQRHRLITGIIENTRKL